MSTRCEHPQSQDELTIAHTINPSSQPKARTTRNRTKHRSNTVISDRPKKTEVTMVMASLRPETMFALRYHTTNNAMKEMERTIVYIVQRNNSIEGT